MQSLYQIAAGIRRLGCVESGGSGLCHGCAVRFEIEKGKVVPRLFLDQFLNRLFGKRSASVPQVGNMRTRRAVHTLVVCAGMLSIGACDRCLILWLSQKPAKSSELMPRNLGEPWMLDAETFCEQHQALPVCQLFGCVVAKSGCADVHLESAVPFSRSVTHRVRFVLGRTPSFFFYCLCCVLVCVHKASFVTVTLLYS
jgi:hypothetical protein